MKMMSPELYGRYSAILRHLRASGRTLDLFAMQAAADLAIAVETGDLEEASRLRARLGLDEEPEASA